MKFAILITSTIGFSLAYAFLFFGAIVHIMGPEGDFGNILVWFNKCKGKKNVSENE